MFEEDFEVEKPINEFPNNYFDITLFPRQQISCRSQIHGIFLFPRKESRLMNGVNLSFQWAGI